MRSLNSVDHACRGSGQPIPFGLRGGRSKGTILDNGFATQMELDAINARVNAIVDESVKFAEESPWPDDSEVLKDVYIDQNYPFIVD